MQFALFYHSLVSDWNHGNAHFLRGVVSELLSRGDGVRVFEPDEGWSYTNLLQEGGPEAVREFRDTFPHLASERYDAEMLDLDRMLDGVDVVVAHEWTSVNVLTALARHRIGGGQYRLLFHDTHHRAVSDPDALAAMPLDRFDGILAFGASLADHYQRLGFSKSVCVWHEAADTRVFYPRPRQERRGDLVWIGNWGDDERAAELDEFLLGPVHDLGLKARIYGVRYPAAALDRLRKARIDYAGWTPNHRVPEIFAGFDVTVHVPRRPYVRMLLGIPTIRPFEALACGIPLISAPWDDVEALFRPGDYLRVNTGEEMTAALRTVLADKEFAAALAAAGLETIQRRHTCAHRVDELLTFLDGCPRPGSVHPLASQEA